MSAAKNKAIIVVAHAILVIIWHVLATGKPYDDLGADYFTRRLDPDRETRRLIARLEALGHHVTIEDPPPDLPPPPEARRTNRAGRLPLPGWGPFTYQSRHRTGLSGACPLLCGGEFLAHALTVVACKPIGHARP